MWRRSTTSAVGTAAAACRGIRRREHDDVHGDDDREQGRRPRQEDPVSGSASAASPTSSAILARPKPVFSTSTYEARRSPIRTASWRTKTTQSIVATT